MENTAKVSYFFKISMFIMTILMGLIILSRVSFAAEVSPVIDDQLHILSDQQKQQIIAENEKLAHKPTKQQIWFISTNKAPSDFDKFNSPLDLETLKDSGFSLLNLQEATLDFVNDFTHEYTGLNEHSEDPVEQQTFDQVGDYVTIILVAPKFKYSVMPLLSFDAQRHIGDVRDFIMTRQLNFKDDSQSNVMHTVNFVSSFLNTKGTDEDDNGGLTDVGLTGIIIGLVVLLMVIHHIRHRHDPKGPGRSPEIDDASAKYDNGWLDGVYYGENSGDDSFKD